METENNQHVIEVERTFDADVETLFRAWTEEAHLTQWWHPMGENLTRVENELREGGTVAYYIGEAGMEVTGTYKEVVPNEKLVYTWIWNMNDQGSADGYVLHVQFASAGEGQSKLTVKQEGFSAQEFLKPHEEGWEKGLNDLSSYLSGQA